MRVCEEPIKVTLSRTRVRMLIVQPHLDFQQPAQEPFPIHPECIQRLGQSIDSVLDRAATLHPNVVLFPEFTLPGVEGVERLVTRLSEGAIPSPTIVIAGISGLSNADYRRLCSLPAVAPIDAENHPDRVQGADWVNTSVTFVKDDDGTVRLWVQPKISPSWIEANRRYQSMFQGGIVRIFRAQFDNDVPCRFLSLLCFDWVGHEDGLSVPESMLQQFDHQCRASGSPQDLQWVFVLQHNDSPNHATFLTATQRFLTLQQHPFVRRQDAAVVMACTASSRTPARRGPFGYSSLIFSPRTPFDSGGCQPTFATQSSRLRQSTTLGTCKDVVFREMGECIHAADVRVPNFVVADPTDRTAALLNAQALPLLGPVVDPRIPGEPVPAVVKWTNDELDDVPDLCATYFAATPIEPSLRKAHDHVVDGYRRLRSQDLAVRIDAAWAGRAPGQGSSADPAADVDTAWDINERSGLRHVIQTLTLIGGCVDLDPVGSKLHARYTPSGVEIAAIAGATHGECVSAFKALAERTHSPIVFVSRDDNNARHLPREAEVFTDPRGGTGVKFTDAQTLLSAAQGDEATFTQYVAELLNAEDRRII